MHSSTYTRNFLVLLSIVLCAPGPLSSLHTFHYQDEDDWSKVAHECSGRSQSPIDIHVNRVKVDSSLALTLRGFNQPIDGSSFELSNNGHTVVLALNHAALQEIQIPTIKGSPLNDQSYKFMQLHFHWHSNDSAGSEHAIDGKRYALEMHYVLMNTRYKSIDEAKEYHDGLAVLATLFQKTRKDNSNLIPLLDGIQKVKYEGSKTTLSGSSIVLDDMLPNNLDSFFKYSGSLTTPPCSESVKWFIYREISGISRTQLGYFRQVMMQNDKHDVVPIGTNVRPLQQLRKRQVYASFPVSPPSPSPSLSAGATPSSMPSHTMSLLLPTAVVCGAILSDLM